MIRPPALVPASRVGRALREPGRALTGTVARAISTAYRDRVLADGAALYWRFRESVGETIAVDSSGNGRSGTYVGATDRVASPICRESDTAVDLDGSTGYVSSTYSPYVAGTVRTFEGWAWRDTATNKNSLFGGTIGQRMYIRVNAGSNDMVFGNGVGNAVWTAAWPGTGQWVHWVLVIDDPGDTAKLYINGALVSSEVVASTWVGADNFAAGTDFAAPGFDEWDGKLDEVAVYEYGLSADQIKAHFDLGSTGALSVLRATETDTAQAVSPRRSYAVGQASSAESAQLVSPAKRRAVGQASASNTAQAVSARRLHATGQTSETDVAQAIAARKVRAAAQATEADASQAVSGRKSKAIAQANETEAAQSATPRRLEHIGQPVETSSSQPFGVARSRAVGQAAESGSAQAVTPRRLRAVDQAGESDIAQPVGVRKSLALGRAGEIDAATSCQIRKARSIGQAAEAAAAQPLGARKLLAVAQTQESDTALVVSTAGTLRVDLGQSQESDASRPFARLKRLTLGQAQEGAAAQGLRSLKRLATAQAPETDAGGVITPALSHIFLVGRAAELDVAMAIIRRFPASGAAGHSVVGLTGTSSGESAGEMPRSSSGTPTGGRSRA